MRSARTHESYLHTPVQYLPDTPECKRECCAASGCSLRSAYRSMHRRGRRLSHSGSPLLLPRTSPVRQNALQAESQKFPVRSFQGIQRVRYSLPLLHPQEPVPYGFRSQRCRPDIRRCLLRHILPCMRLLKPFFCLRKGIPGNSHGSLPQYQFLLLECCSLFCPPVYFVQYSALYGFFLKPVIIQAKALSSQGSFLFYFRLIFSPISPSGDPSGSPPSG